LQTQFEDPVFLTTKALHGDFVGNPNVHLGMVDQKHNNEQKTEVKKVERDRTMSSSQVNIVISSDQVNIVTPSDQAKAEAVAVLMLTSGSTGRLKAVGITNR
jgi:long-subunit acyl-CoA synthetase (AMP-forming)